MMRITGLTACILFVVFTLSAAAAAAETETDAVPYRALEKMPVREVTVFKDGHAYVLHEGVMKTDKNGNVEMDYLPAPVLGTFFPYSADPDAKLKAVVAGRRKVLVERTALSHRELLEANIGARVRLKDSTGEYTAVIAGVPERTSRELEETSPTGSVESLPVKGNVILLKTEQGTKVAHINQIQQLTFLDSYKKTVSNEEFRNLLTLKMEWKENKTADTAKVGLVYLQKGLRWIPNYRVTIDGKGKAVIKLQATLINELTDLDSVTMNLVIGVPTFDFKETTDPMALGGLTARLSPYFQRGSQTGYALSNAIMSQSARMGEYRAPVPARPVDLGPEMEGSGKSEDLFIFTVKNVTLKKGERMVIPVAEYALDYEDVYTLDVPFCPPPEVRRNFNNTQQAELAKLFHAPKVMHKIRLKNKSEYPLTTAPALIVREGRLLAQGMMTYTAVGASSDLKITTAVDIRVKKDDAETKRTPNAATWHNYKYDRIDLAGTIGLTNHGKREIKVEVRRYVLGNVDVEGTDGKAEQVNVFEFDEYLQPSWWNWYNWPSWWRHFNGLGRITWNVKLEPGKSADLGYKWHYYWR
ncbi:MAG: hypothetical protein ACYS8W_05725 [Planctomycetota bacterium]|jgi:hypothetical protein